MSPYLRWIGLFLISSLIHTAVANGQELSPADSRYAESFPTFSPDGQTLYFSLANHPRNQGSANAEDIWLVQRLEDGNWSRALNAGAPINSFAQDRIIGIGPNGQELAVLRIGTVAYIDLLVKGQRSWRIESSWPLDKAIAQEGHPFFDLENRRLFFQKTSASGHEDLYLQQARFTGDWDSPQPLNQLNTEGQESRPYLAADGLSFYFQRDGVWQYSSCSLSSPGQAPLPTPSQAIHEWTAAQAQSISFSVLEPVQLVVSNINATGQLQLTSLSCSPQFRPQNCRLLSGKMELPPAPSDQSFDPSLRLMVDGRERKLRPDAAGNYHLIVPANSYAAIVADAPGYFSPGRSIDPSQQLSGQADNSQAGLDYSSAYQERERVVQQISSRIHESQAELNRLREERRLLDIQLREEQLAAGQDILAGYVDPEIEALRHRYREAQQPEQDTIPPTNTDSPSARRRAAEDQSTRGSTNNRRSRRTADNNPANTGADFDELERQKAIFRAQQEELLVQQGRHDFQWQADANQDSLIVPPPANARTWVARTIEENWVPQVSEQISQELGLDSLRIQGDIRQGLFPDQSPAVYERAGWENELLTDIRPAAEAQLRERLTVPIQQNLQERQRIDVAYQSHESEIARLRDSLTLVISAQFREEEQLANSNEAPANRDLRVKGDLSATASSPSTYQAPAPRLAFIPLEPGAHTVLEQLQFAPNSAYFKPIALPEMDRLVLLLQEQPALKIVLSVHTNAVLSYTAAQSLSEARAAAILSYFQERSISGERVAVEAFGRSQPLTSSDDPLSRSRNQRVELTIR